MEKVISEFVELAKSDRNVIKELKAIAVKFKQYELVKKLQDIEAKHYPEAKQDSEEYINADRIRRIFSLFDIEISNQMAFMIRQISLEAEKSQDKFNTNCIPSILKKSKEIFG